MVAIRQQDQQDPTSIIDRFLLHAGHVGKFRVARDDQLGLSAAGRVWLGAEKFYLKEISHASSTK